MNRVLSSLMATLVSVTTTVAAPVPTHPEVPASKSVPKVNHPSGSAKASRTEPKPYQIGIASWYGKQFHGRTTASGE